MSTNFTAFDVLSEVAGMVKQDKIHVKAGQHLSATLAWKDAEAYVRLWPVGDDMMSQPVQSAPVQQPTQSAPQPADQSAPVEVTQPEPSEVAQPVEPADAPDDVVAEFSADPSQYWDDWRTEFGSDADVDVPLSQVPACAALDGSTGTGYEKVCQATSSDGLHYVLVGGTAMEVWR